MTRGGDLTVALKILSDVGAAQKDLANIEQGLGRINALSGKAGGAGVNALATSAQAAATAAQAAAGAHDKLDAAVQRVQPGKVDALAQADRAAADAAKAAAVAQQQLSASAAQSGAVTAAAAGRFKQAGISAGQTAQAMRQLPMQITDITTSLASGMPIWLVAIQQGGQIKDSFGGIGPALRAVAGMVTVSTAAIGGAVAVVGSLALAYKQGSDEGTRFANTLVETGNYAGTSSGQMHDLAREIDAINGTRAKAAEALTAMAASGAITAGSMREIGIAGVAMSDATGRAVGEIVDEFARLAREPAAASAKLNEQYRYLTASVYEQIRALEDQGRSSEAAALAMNTYADTMRSRAAEIVSNMGPIEGAWATLKRTAAEAWDAMLGVGRESTLSEQLEEARERASGARPRFFMDEAEARLEVKVLEAAVEAEKKRATEEGKRAQAEAAAVVAVGEINKQKEAGLNWQERLNKELEKYRANLEKIRTVNPQSANLAPEEVARQEARLRDRYTPNTPQAKSNPVDTAYHSKLQSVTLARVEAELRLKNARDGVAESDNRATTQLEAWMQVSREAQGLSASHVAVLKRETEATDADTAALAALTETKQRSERITAGLAQAEARILVLQGNSADAAVAKAQEAWRKLREMLAKEGNSQGIATIDEILGLEAATAKLAALQKMMDKVLAAQSREEQSIDAQRDSGALTELDARERILDVHRRTYDQLQALRPTLEDLTRAPGAVGEAAVAALQELDTYATRLQSTTSLLASTLKEGLTSGLRQALIGLADGTMTLREAIHALSSAVADALLNMAAENIAESAVGSIKGLLPGSQGNQEASSAQSTVGALAGVFGLGGAGGDGGLASGAAAVTASAGALSSAGGSLIFGAAAIEAAALTLAAANGVSDVAGAASAAGAASSAAGASGGGSSSWVGAIMSAFGFADGGYTGPGAKYEPAGIVHRGEHVTRAAIVSQAGARSFLDDFNALGMTALQRWAGMPGYAEGGLVTAPAHRAATVPAGYQPAKAASTATNVSLSQRLMPVLDDNLISEALMGPRGEEVMVLHISRNPSKFRQLLDL